MKKLLFIASAFLIINNSFAEIKKWSLRGDLPLTEEEMQEAPQEFEGEDRPSRGVEW